MMRKLPAMTFLKRTFILVLLFMPGVIFGQKKPQFNIECQIDCDTARKYADGFERIVEYFLDDQFSCCKTVTKGDIIGKLEADKISQLYFGTGMKSYCEDLACDYFMILYLQEGMGKILATASCYRWKGKEPLSRETLYIPKDGDIVQLMTDVAKSITEKLSKYEICSYEGPVELSVTGKKDTTITVEHSVYCNQMDHVYKKTIVEKSDTHSEWKLQKKSKEFAEGDVTFTINELTTIEEDDGCHKCSTSDREGGRSVNSSQSLDYSSSGLSEESKLDGEVHADARIVLDFRPDDTYTITIKATTKMYQAMERGYIEAVGTCDGSPRENIENARQVSAFAYQVFGPYKGKPTDKTLTMNDSKTFYEPVTHEKTTITIDYTLTRE